MPHRFRLLDDTALTLPDLPVPAAAGSYDLLAPARFDLSRTLGGVLTKVTCAVDEADRLVTTLVVEAPPAPPTGAGGSTDAPAGPVSTGGGTTPVAVVDPTTPNPCVTTPAARAGQRRTRLTTKAAAVSWRRRPAVRVTAKARRKAARGTVIACYGAMQVGHKRLRHGRAVVRTLRFYPGRYRVRVVYLGSAAARAKARTITLRVRR